MKDCAEMKKIIIVPVIPFNIGEDVEDDNVDDCDDDSQDDSFDDIKLVEKDMKKKNKLMDLPSRC